MGRRALVLALSALVVSLAVSCSSAKPANTVEPPITSSTTATNTTMPEFETKSGSTASSAAAIQAGPAIGVYVQGYWRETLQKYRDNASVNQILLVRWTGGSNATVQFFEKSIQNGNVWTMLLETDAFIGRNGAGETTEGDPSTPIGDFGVRQAFGILPNPGTSLTYIDVKPTTFACNEQGPYYNQIIDTEETGHNCSGEEMYAISPEYNYGLAIDYNAANEWPKGSAIFVHCKGAKQDTSGCVALDQDKMETVLKHASPGMRVVINADQ